MTAVLRPAGRSQYTNGAVVHHDPCLPPGPPSTDRSYHIIDIRALNIGGGLLEVAKLVGSPIDPGPGCVDVVITIVGVEQTKPGSLNSILLHQLFNLFVLALQEGVSIDM